MNNKKTKTIKMKAILDLECTCDSPNFLRNEMEIIEIGAISIDDNFNITDSFDVFVKPVIHTTLTDFCKELTTIQQSDVDNGLALFNALELLQQFFVKNNVTEWYSWGYFDNNKILSEMTEKKIDHRHFSALLSIPHKNASDIFMKQRGFKQKKGVSKALKILNLSFIGQKHRAIDDVININQILKAM